MLPDTTQIQTPIRQTVMSHYYPAIQMEGDPPVGLCPYIGVTFFLELLHTVNRNIPFVVKPYFPWFRIKPF